MPKIYAYAFFVVILVGFVKWYSDNQYMAGYNAHKSEVADAKDAANKADEGKVKTVIEYRDKVKVVYRDKVKYIKQIEDKTGCLDTKLTDMGVQL